MKKSDPLAKKSALTQEDITRIPLIMHQRIGLQNEIAHWAGTDLENLNIAATYNVVHGSPVPFVMQGLGYFLTTRNLLAPTLDPEVCFLPLEPKLPTRLALVWKKHAVFSKVAEAFITTLNALIFDQFQAGYYVATEKVGQAWNAGKALMEAAQADK